MSANSKLIVFAWLAVLCPLASAAEVQEPTVPATPEVTDPAAPSRIGTMVNGAFQKLGDATGTRNIVDEVQCRTSNTTWGELGAGAVAVGMGNVIVAGGTAVQVNNKDATQDCIKQLRAKAQAAPVEEQRSDF